jgi:hypothetical protein
MLSATYKPHESQTQILKVSMPLQLKKKKKKKNLQEYDGALALKSEKTLFIKELQFKVDCYSKFVSQQTKKETS